MSNRQERKQRVKANKAERRRALKYRLKHSAALPRTWTILTNPHGTAIGMRYGHRHWSVDRLELH